MKDVYKKMWIPYLGNMADRWPEYDIRCEGACSSCQALLALNMETLKALGIYEENSDKTIVVGPRNTIPDKPKDKIILHGNCTKRFADKGMWIPGCIENVIRTSMEADHPKWRAYVEQKAKEFYENPENQ